MITQFMMELNYYRFVYILCMFYTRFEPVRAICVPYCTIFVVDG